MLPKDSGQRVTLNEERIKYWLGVGAQPSDRVARFLADANMGEKPAIPEQTKQHLPKAKAQERLKEAEEAANAPAEEAPAEETAAEEAPAEEAPAEEAPAEEAAPEEVAEEAVEAQEEAPVEEVPVEETPAEEEAPAEDNADASDDDAESKD